MKFVGNKKTGKAVGNVKLSTKGRYGVRAMFDLALVYGQAPQSVKCIAERQSIPEAYLEQLIAPLRKAGLVQSIRGAQGGYTLAMEPKDISVGAILRAVEGPLAATECITDACANSDGCAMHMLWQRIHVGVNEVMDSITLQDMLDDVNAHCGEGRCSCH